MSFIVKMQRSLATTAPVGQLLVYNEDRSVQFQMDMTDAVNKLMGGRDKVYALATRDKKKQLRILRLVKAQNW